MSENHDTKTSESVQILHAWIEAHQEEMIAALQGVLRIPSLEAAGQEGAPFGKPVREALDYTLNLCGSMGFQVKDDAGYAGHAEFGSGEEMVAAVGHLDVVPEGDGWTFPPYGATRHDGYLYARGAADDKGPTYAALFGARALKESGLPIRRRVRVIFGCNEESGFGCVTHYWEVSKEERPVYAFTPDAAFPLIYAEKGIANLILERELPEGDPSIRIVKLQGGRRPNIVPDFAEAVLVGEHADLSAALTTLTKFWDRNVSAEYTGSQLVVQAVGKSAHGARPEGGDNAVARLARALLTLGRTELKPILQWINRSADTAGIGLGITHSDDVAGPLTNNLGIIELTSYGKVRITYNIRYPVTWSIQELLAANRPVLEKEGWKLAEYFDQPPLYVPLDQEPVATLLRVYQEETGDVTSKPGTMGGGTYARATPHAVAYGAGFPGASDGPAHEPDERIAISTLVRAAKIYAHALYELAK